ncbi:hypothetical protein GCM10009750_17080 [Agromyces salentinus]|uniref:Uncharacterized protein n=1 Tax=Agromyces salentinus TaxID=269421 RepID=A0ABN2MPH2_9MICO
MHTVTQTPVSPAVGGPLPAERARPSVVGGRRVFDAPTGLLASRLEPRFGSAEIVGLATCYASTTYTAIHSRLHRERGSASRHRCIICNERPATAWACYPCRAPVEGRNASGRAVTFSTDLRDYRPLCSSCHRSYDALRARSRRAPAPISPPVEPALFDLDPDDDWTMR